MVRRMSLRRYIESISSLDLPKPFSDVTERFVDYVINAHSWYKLPEVQNPEINMIPFNFFVGPGPLIEATGATMERRLDDFQFLKYGCPISVVRSRENARIPREIYDAGLVIVQGFGEHGYRSASARRIMVARVANMLEAVAEHSNKFSFLRQNETTSAST